MNRAKVKVCGLTRREDAVHAAEAGADYLGVILVPSSPRFRDGTQARSILRGIDVPSVLVVANQDPAETISVSEFVGASVIQLHGNETLEDAAKVRAAGPWEVWKAIRVRGPEQIRESVARFETHVDALLLDAWHPEKIGGTGRVFSWKGAAKVRSVFPKGLKLVAAGGLNPANVKDAIETLLPDVVDVSSGVEAGPGLKEKGLVEAFIQNARGAGRGT